MYVSVVGSDEAVSARGALRDARRVVVKVGSRSLLAADDRFAALAAQLAHQITSGRQMLLVSSGAIALGRARLGMTARPNDMARLQAAAAVGQSALMHRWERAFETQERHVAQVLLTHADLADRERWLNARNALDALLELGAVPVINENDTVAVDEIRFGDNDQLAAMVATLAGADLMVLLTDVDGVEDASGTRLGVIQAGDALEGVFREASDDVGRGGMRSKVDSARRATHRGVPAIIASAADPDALTRILAGEDVGTLLLPRGARLASRKHWIAYTLKPSGAIVVDAGAAEALARHASLLPAGIVGVRGAFEPGDAVRLIGPSGEFARGLVRYGVSDVARLAGARSAEVERRLGRPGAAVVVHRDDLVVVVGSES